VIFRETSGDQSYLIAVARSPERVPPEVDTIVGLDEVFVMGDNRYDALDSRYSGPIPFASIVGKTF
jgi:type IV secretory pathway protease TraF